MPSVRPGFRDDVHHRSRIATVFWTELIRDQYILVYPFGIGHKQPRSSDAIVVIVLPVNLLVIIASTDTVYAETLAAVEVGKVVVAGRTYAGDKERQVVQAFIVLHADEGRKNLRCEGIGHLRLRRLDEPRGGHYLDRSACVADGQHDGPHSGVPPGRHGDVGLSDRFEAS